MASSTVIDVDHLARLYMQAATLLDPVRFQARERLGVTFPQLRILFYICRKPGVDIRGLAEELGISASAVSQQVDRLVGRQFVHRTDNPEDRRRVALALTEHGLELTEEVSRASQDRIAVLLSRLSKDEMADLQRVLQRLLNETRD
jgi:DNA-binding MarR family transcriptional regulator